jgi:zinc metalloprotease ZmpB
MQRMGNPMIKQLTVCYCLILLSLIPCGFMSAAVPQQNPFPQIATTGDFNPPVRAWFGLDEATAARSNEAAAREYLTRYYERFGSAESIAALAFVGEKSSPSGSHLLFRQMVDGIPVYHAEVRVHMDHERTVNAATSSVQREWMLDDLLPTVSSDAAIMTALPLVGEPRPDSHPYAEQMIVVDSETGQGSVVWRVRLTSMDPLGDWEVLVNASSGEILLVDNRMAFENGEGLAFDPDPLTTAEVVYGTDGYVDNDDADSPELNAERVPVLLRDITMPEFYWWLEGPYVQIVDFEPPTIEPVHSASLNGFTYTRNESGFEDVNAYYHIDSMQRRFRSMGFTDLQDAPIWVDTHAANGQDVSYYSPEENRLGFGEGGVDDAEDADVLRHEYAHALHHDAVGGELWGVDIRSIAEGLCDYWAASLSDRTSTYHNYWVYNWDGHNEFWDGRLLNTQDVYPDDWTEDLYRNGTIWVDVLWSIHVQLDADITDELVAQSLYYMTPGIDPETAALALLQAEDDRFGGLYRLVVLEALVEKGFLPAVGSLAGTITDEISGDPIEGADITLDAGTLFSGASDGLGTYHLDEIPVGEWPVTVSAEGYRTEIVTGNIELGQVTVLDIELSSIVAAVNVDSLNVHAYIGENVDTSFVLTSLNDDIFYLMRADPVDLDPIQPYEEHATFSPNMPPEEIQDVVFINRHYYVTHTAAGAVYSVYVLNVNGQPVRSFPQPDNFGLPFRGLTTDGEFLYSIESNAIVKYDTLGVRRDEYPDVNPTYEWLAYDKTSGWFWCAREDGVIEPYMVGSGHFWEPIETGLPITGIAYDAGREDRTSVVLLTDPVDTAPEIHFYHPGLFELSDEFVTLADDMGPLLGGAVFTGLQQPLDYRYFVTLMGEANSQQLQLYRIRWTIPYISFDQTSGFVYGNESETIRVHAASQNLDTGTYRSLLKIFFPLGGSTLEVLFTLNITAVAAPDPSEVDLPNALTVGAPSPNPCNATTVLAITVPHAGDVSLTVYDILGRQVDQLDWQQLAGTKRVSWTPAPGLASGMYLMRVEADGLSPALRKVVVVK